ncbi:MAG: hypothetical protein GEV04_18175 [Actinophytocola sp.]|nr:hypothetical protein [Actinophytocola sp.]
MVHDRIGQGGARAMRARKASRGIRGQVTIETIAYLPLLFAIFFTIVEVFAYFMTVEQVDSAARAAARVQSQGGNGYQAARSALPESVRRQGATVDVSTQGRPVTATVTGNVPIIISGPIDWTVTRTVTMPIG